MMYIKTYKQYNISSTHQFWTALKKGEITYFVGKNNDLSVPQVSSGKWDTQGSV